MRLVLQILICSCLSAGLQAADWLSAEQANEEVELLYASIRSTHPAPFLFVDEDQWQARLSSLLARRGPVSAVQQYFALASLMALATDTHVQIYPAADTPGFTRSYPLRFRLYREGVYITAADSPYREWVGARVLSIAGRPMAEVVEQLAAHAFSDHPLRQRSWGVEYLLPHPATYQYFGWADGERVALELEFRDGSRASRQLQETVEGGFDAVLGSGTAAAYYWPRSWRTLDDLRVAPQPLSRSHLDRNYWYTDLGDGVVYAQLNGPYDQSGAESLNAFTLRLFADIESRAVEPDRLIVDLRYDLGGSIDLSLPWAYLAAASRLCCKPGRIVVLIGRETISAGSMLAGAMEAAARAVMIGEPSGGKPNIFIGHQPLELPYSGLLPEISSRIFYATDASDRRQFIAPDIPVSESIEDVLAGRDPALESAIALDAEQAARFFTAESRIRPWLRPSQLQGAAG